MDKNYATGVRQEFLNASNKLLPEVKAAIANGTLTLVDAVIYSARALNADTSIELMQSSDTQREGVTNVNNRKLESGQYMLLKGIRLQTAAIAGSDAIDAAKIAAADYDAKINTQVANGELDIIVAGKTLFPRNSCQIFSTGSNSPLRGYYPLDCPKIIVPQAEIVPTLRLNASSGGRVVARIELHGVKTVRG
jgi:hypothetical protein